MFGPSRRSLGRFWWNHRVPGAWSAVVGLRSTLRAKGPNVRHDRSRADRQTTRKNGDSDAIIALGRRSLSYKSLVELIESTVRELNGHGLGRDDRVAVVLPNGAEMATCCIAICAGATCAPLNPDYTAAEFEQLFGNLTPTLLITAPGFGESARAAAMACEIAIAELVGDSNAEAGRFGLSWVCEDVTSPGTNPGLASASDIALVLHTSGSTSLPKIVPLDHRNLCASACNVAASLALGADDHCLNMMPMYHVGALVDLVLSPLSVGGSVVTTRSLSSSEFFDCLSQARPTWYQGVPTMLQDVVERARLDGRRAEKTSLRFARAVSAPLPDRVMEDFELQFEVPVIEIYGMTETAGLITSNPLPPAVRKKGSVGIAAGPEISILDAAGNPAKTGESGEVVIRGENVMRGYEGDPQLNVESFVGPWLRSGDEGYIDDDGFLFLTGRIKEIINRGGEKISPREIDDIALEHPAIAEVATFPIDHPSLGEEVAIAVVLRPDADAAEISERDLIDFFSSRLAYFKVPRAIFFADELPKTASGKLKRHAVAGAIGVGSREIERAEWVAPESPLARSLASMWERALGVTSIGIHDNFFDLGGDSLKAATFMRELVADGDLNLPIAALFDAPTIAEFESILEQNGYRDIESLVAGRDVLLPSGLPVSIHRELWPRTSQPGRACALPPTR